MVEVQVTKNKPKKEKLYIFLIRWWCAGAVFFFIGWGTQAGSHSSILDLVALLAIVIGLFNSYITNPSIKMLFNAGNQKPYKDMNVVERVLLRFKDVGISLIVVSLIAAIYQGINVGAIYVFDLSKEAVFLPAEPIIFGLLYALIMIFGGNLINKIRMEMKAKKDEVR